LNNKNLKYFLFSIVIIVWGLIILSIIKSLSSQKAARDEAKLQIHHAQNYFVDTFILIQDYPDPFLPSNDSLDAQDRISNVSNRTNPPIVSEDSLFRIKINKSVKLNGVIKSSGDKKMIGMITINGKEYVVKSGQIVEDVLISKITKDAVMIVVNKRKFNIARSTD
jgi:hypothetical protein